MSYSRGYDQVKDQGNTPPTYHQRRDETDPIAAYAQEGVQQPQANNDFALDQHKAPSEDESSIHGSVAYLNLDFSTWFKEHESTKTISFLYTALDYTYKYIKLVVYHVFVLLFGIFFAILFAILNGALSFFLVWVFTPAVKFTVVLLYAGAPLITAPLRAIYIPLVDVHARIFRQIRVHLSGPITNNGSRQRSNV